LSLNKVVFTGEPETGCASMIPVPLLLLFPSESGEKSSRKVSSAGGFFVIVTEALTGHQRKVARY
jgi:hypothetical protein